MLFVRVFFPFAFGYAISYFYRNANAIIQSNLVDDLGLGPADLGLLTSAYFFSFAVFQLPLGILLDRYGPRRTEAALLLFAALGALIFSNAETSTGLVLGRLLIGLGVSSCLMAAFKAFVIWFQSERLPMINGLQMVAGGLGALGATTPLQNVLYIMAGGMFSQCFPSLQYLLHCVYGLFCRSIIVRQKKNLILKHSCKKWEMFSAVRFSGASLH